MNSLMPQAFIEHLLCDLLTFCITCNPEIRLIKAEPYKGATFFALFPLSTRNPHLTICIKFTNLYQFKMTRALTLSPHLPLSPFSVCSAILPFCGSSDMLLPPVICLCCPLYLQCSSPSLNLGPCLGTTKWVHFVMASPLSLRWH